MYKSHSQEERLMDTNYTYTEPLIMKVGCRENSITLNDGGLKLAKST